MTKKHYIAIAQIIKEHKNKLSDKLHNIILIQELVNALCKYFKKDNPKFDEKKFQQKIYE